MNDPVELPPSSPRFWRRAEALFLAAAASTVAFTILAVGQGRSALEARFDQRIALDVRGALPHGWRPLFLGLSFLGSAPFTAAATAACAVLLGWSQARRRSVVLVVGVLGAALLVQLFKILIHRARPRIFAPLAAATGFSFPSGHSATSAALFGAVAAIAAVSTRSPGRSAAFLSAGLAMTLGVGLSRIWLGVHWPTDVLGGWSLGFGWLFLVFAISRPRRGRQRS